MLAQLWRHRRPLLGFALAFQLLENLLSAPAMAFLGRALQGRPVVDSTELVAFFLSPRGFLLLFLAVTTWLTIRLVEHAGLSALVLGLAEGKHFRPSATLGWLARESPRLAAVGARVVGWTLAVTAPFGVAAGLVARPLLARHDINYYLAHRPPEFAMAGAVLGLMAVATISAGVWLLVRWRLVVQVCVFDRRNAGENFREAAVLSCGVRWPLLGRCLAVTALLLALTAAAAAFEQLAVWLALHPGQIGRASLAVSSGVVILLRTAVGAAVTSVGACAEAIVFTSFYRQRRLALGGQWALPAIEENRGAPSSLPAAARLLVLGGVAGLIIATGVSVALAADALPLFGNRRWQNLPHCGGQSVLISGERIEWRFLRRIWLVLRVHKMRSRRVPWHGARRWGKQPGGIGQGLVVPLPIVETIANMSYRKFISWL